MIRSSSVFTDRDNIGDSATSSRQSVLRDPVSADSAGTSTTRRSVLRETGSADGGGYSTGRLSSGRRESISEAGSSSGYRTVTDNGYSSRLSGSSVTDNGYSSSSRLSRALSICEAEGDNKV